MNKNEEIMESIKHNEWFIINGGLNLARLRTLGYYVDNNGEKIHVGLEEADAHHDYYVDQIRQRGKAILSLKDSMMPERLSRDSEFNTPP